MIIKGRNMSKLIKKYKLGFEVRGLVLFLIIMLPNFIWFAVPAPNDILRAESVTETVDLIGSVCQVIMVGALCVLINKECPKFKFTPLIISVIVCAVGYFKGWIFYYCGIANSAVVLALTALPCAAFLLFTLDRKNYVALIPTAGFTICHLIYGIANFIAR